MIKLRHDVFFGEDAQGVVVGTAAVLCDHRFGHFGMTQPRFNRRHALQLRRV